VHHFTVKHAEPIDLPGSRLKKYLYSFTVRIIMDTLGGHRTLNYSKLRDWGIK